MPERADPEHAHRAGRALHAPGDLLVGEALQAALPAKTLEEAAVGVESA
jgi:hypothetical protein